MALTKQTSKRKRRKEVVPTLGIVGVSLSLAGGGSAALSAPAADISQNTARVPEITLNEEEISDVSLGTFFVFRQGKRRDAPARRTTGPRLQWLRRLQSLPQRV
jgi:hypothetical protein